MHESFRAIIDEAKRNLVSAHESVESSALRAKEAVARAEHNLSALTEFAEKSLAEHALDKDCSYFIGEFESGEHAVHGIRLGLSTFSIDLSGFVPEGGFKGRYRAVLVLRKVD